MELMDLSPRGIREHLGLSKPIYARTAAYGHFGREPEADGGFSWEKDRPRPRTPHRLRVTGRRWRDGAGAPVLRLTWGLTDGSDGIRAMMSCGCVR